MPNSLTVASGVEMYRYSNGERLTGRAAFEDRQLDVNPRPFDNPVRPQFRMTNALAWAITTGVLWRIRITSLLGWVWESPLHLGGYSDLEKHPTDAVDPGTFDVRFSGDGIGSWLRGWMPIASVYGKTFGADVYDDGMRSVQNGVALHRSRPSIHTKKGMSRGLYSLLYRWHDEMCTASKVPGAAAAAAYPYSPWELLRAQETGCYIPRLDFYETV